jgi:hypothetical protein
LGAKGVIKDESGRTCVITLDRDEDAVFIVNGLPPCREVFLATSNKMEGSVQTTSDCVLLGNMDRLQPTTPFRKIKQEVIEVVSDDEQEVIVVVHTADPEVT